MWLAATTASAQEFFNLTAEQVKIDSLLPVFTHQIPVGRDYAGRNYTVSIVYPEFVPMNKSEVVRYQQISGAPLPELPEISQVLCVDRKQGDLVVSFVPFVFRDGKYQKLVSFKLEVGNERSEVRSRRAESGGYAEHSVLATGKWVKISVPSTGIYHLTDEVVRKAGFTDINKVKIYGYGGALQPEKISSDYLAKTDDLPEVPSCVVNGRRLFYAVGPVSWDASHRRVRNPYSTHGYYFLTEGDAPLTVDGDAFLASCYPKMDDYNTLYEIDDYAWYHGGRNLYDARPFTVGTKRDYTIDGNANTQSGTVTVAMTAYTSGQGNNARADIIVNGEKVGTISITPGGNYDAMKSSTQSYRVNLKPTNTITISHTEGSGSTMRLDYISLHSDEVAPAPDLSNGTFPAPEVVYGITNQDHHADTAVDMVIIIPTTQKLLTQAERLKTLHEQKDGLRVRIVPADELFNEFSSGTPDANAYRRYLRMLYDRAATDADMPRYLLLMGDGVWDNRMLTSSCKNLSPDDFLLCFESENSSSATDCYVSDDFFGLLDDGEGADLKIDKSDVAVGRITARTADDAAIVVDKIVNYANNENAGVWQNVLCFMGDDGNQNAHMEDADSAATMVETLYPTYQVKRIMWDAYTRVSSSTGYSYPDVTHLIKQQMQNGALIMDYAGHGRADAISHEYVLRLTDFENTSTSLPLWVTASCDIMPFDGVEENIGETAMFNRKGGSIAFFGTTRTVYQIYNKLMNLAFVRHVLSKDATTQLLPIGEAVRRAKNELIETGIVTGYSNGKPVYSSDRTLNKLQYSLLGDPALRLAAPTMGITVDTINDVDVSSGTMQTLSAGSTVKVSGHVTRQDGILADDFNGTVTVTVRDAIEQVICKLNDPSEASVPFVYNDRPNVVFRGSDQLKDGRFAFSFAVPKDISYSDLCGQLNLYALSSDKQQKASGINEQLIFGSGQSTSKDTNGPSIYCYLNSESFSNGDNVNPTPYFVAQLHDDDGINATGSGIGHDLQLIIDGEATKTYSLNDAFQYDFGSYTSGTVGFSIPELSYGSHKLLFRAWDVLNNSSTAELTFNVVKALEPHFFDVECLVNPAKTTTSFRVIHDRTGSDMDFVLDVFDTSGRLLWSRSESGVPTDRTYVIDWDLTVDGGRRLQTGVYLYRLRISSDGSSYASKAKKLIVLTHK